MNVMKQDAMNDKIIERYKNMWKTMHARGSQQIEKLSSCYRVEANLDGLRICQGCVEQTDSTRFWLDGLTYLLRNCWGQTQKSR